MNKNQFLDKWIECLPLNSKDQDRKEMSYDLDLLMAKGRSEQLVAFLKWVGDGYDFENNAEEIVREYIDEGN